MPTDGAAASKARGDVGSPFMVMVDAPSNVWPLKKPPKETVGAFGLLPKP